jgi:hypothetical protein
MFSIDQVPETKEIGFTLLPKGGYRVLVSKCELKYKDGSIHSGSSYFSIAFDIIPYAGAGEYELAGRKAFVNITWENKNAEAVDIGRGKLADLMFAVGIPTFTSTSSFCNMIVNRECYIEIGHKLRKDNGQMETVINGFWNAQSKLQRKAKSKPIPPPPTAADVASAPPQPPRSGPAVPHGHPAFDDAPPF